MSRLFTRAVVMALVGAVASAALVALAFWRYPAIALEMDRDIPGATSGFSPVERHLDETYAWSSGRAQVLLPGLDRTVTWRCVFRIRGSRPPGVPQPHVQIGADGVTLASATASNTYQDIDALVAAREERNGLTLMLATDPTWVPGPGDPRALGVQVDRVTCRPADDSMAWPPLAVLGAAAVAGAAFGAAFALSGLGTTAALALTLLTAAAQTMPLASGTAAFGTFPGRAIALSMWISVLMLVAIKAVEAVRRQPLSWYASCAVAVSFSTLYLKLLALLHPSKLLVDAVFHAHRFEGVQAGRYFFAQTMPDGVQFPYAIALYVFALPWAAFTTDHVLLLRVVVCAVEAFAGLLLYPMIVRTWDDRLAGVFAVVYFAVTPLAFIVVGNANLTNAFGRSSALVAVAAAVWLPLSKRGALLQFVGLTLLISVALLSHVSTLSLLSVTLFVAAGLYWWKGGAGLRAPARWLAASVVLAALLSVVTYYGHFADVFKTLERVRSREAMSATVPAGAEGAAATPAEGTAGHQAAGAQPPRKVRGTMASALPERTVLAVSLSSRAVGWPIFVLAVLGMWRLWARGARDRLGLMLLAWGVTWLAFVAVVMVAPVDERFQRYAIEFLDRVNYTLAPAFTILASLAAAWAWRAGMLTRALALLLTIAAIVLGAQQWVGWLR